MENFWYPFLGKLVLIYKALEIAYCYIKFQCLDTAVNILHICGPSIVFRH